MNVSGDLDSLLGALRKSRGFQAQGVLLAKLGRLAQFFASQNLNAAVVGVSGGVDSALVLALLETLRKQPGSPLLRVVALLMPIEGRGATGQAVATDNGRKVATMLGAEVWEAPLGEAHAATVLALQRASALDFDAWAEGQCLSVMRTPALYGAAALLQRHGFRSLVAGTTNRDEGAYLGFFGKASDGMVDLQPISDLHKSEVRALARLLGLPEEIVTATPRGDVYDGRTDEQMIGANYDAIEAVLRLKELDLPAELAGHAPAAAVQRHHQMNAHKYAVGSPAVHLDVLPRGVPGGWTEICFAGRNETRPAPGILLGEWDPPEISLDPFVAPPQRQDVPLQEGVAFTAHEVLSQADCGRLAQAFRDAGDAQPVGVSGIVNSAGYGSVRRTAWAPQLSRDLWRRLAPCAPSVRFTDAFTPTDAFATEDRKGHCTWRVVGLSPVLRFMRYEPGGEHYCHYDAGFDYGDGRRSLMSVVFYLSDAQGSGATRFVDDGQQGMPAASRNFSDWTRPARTDEVRHCSNPVKGSALVFDHRLCHDVQRWDGPGSRIIIRADVVYEAVPDGRF